MNDSILRRLAVLEQQVRFLSQTLEVACPPFGSDAAGLPAEVVELAHRGRKIEAIKLLRELTGMGLAEAKATLDSL
jgi:ribosomal protein L7/L12